MSRSIALGLLLALLLGHAAHASHAFAGPTADAPAASLHVAAAHAASSAPGHHADHDPTDDRRPRGPTLDAESGAQGCAFAPATIPARAAAAGAPVSPQFGSFFLLHRSEPFVPPPAPACRAGPLTDRALLQVFLN